jgi:type IV pilus assembly protein PilY1
MRWLAAVLLSGSVIALSGDSVMTDSILLDLGEEASREVVLVGGGYRGELCPEVQVDEAVDVAANAIHMIDPVTGTAIWSVIGPGAASSAAEGGIVYSQPLMTHSVVAPITSADSDGNGLVDRAYVADSGGVLWRLTFPEAGAGYAGATSNILAGYTAKPLALLGGEGAVSRRFFRQVDYVRSRDEMGDYDGIFLVSGNRTGTAGAGVQNYAYLVKDRDGQPVHHDQLPDITLACAQRTSADCRELNLHRGWKLALEGMGEIGVSRPLISRGVVYFTTYLPPEGEGSSCDQTVGEGLIYAVNLADGSPVRAEVTELAAQIPVEQDLERKFLVGPGVPGAVIPSGEQVLLPGSGDLGLELPRPGGPFRWRIYWREEGVDLQ